MESKKVAAALRRMVAESDTARAIFGWLSEYTRNAANSPVELFERDATRWGREHLDAEMVVTRQNAIEVMKRLDELKLGRFIVGRRGADTRFEFWSSRVQIGQAAMGMVDRIDLDEEPVALEENEIIETHRLLLANALGKPISAVRVRIRE